MEFIAPASKSYVRADELAALDRATATEVDYIAGRDARVPAAGRGSWAVCEDTMTIRGKRTRDPVLVLRRVFVHSGARGPAAATARAKKLDRARDDLDRLGRGLGGRHYPDQPAVTARITAFARPPGRRLPAHRGGHRPGPGKPTHLVVRPGRAGRRGRHRRLACPAHQPARHHHPSRLIPDKGQG